MGLLEKAKKIDDHISDSETAYVVKEVLDTLLPFVLIVLVAALYLEFFGHLSHHQHQQLLLVEKGILGFFILELLVDLGIYRDNQEFLRDRWVDILLVFPFFVTIREVGRLLRGLKSLKSMKLGKGLKLGKSTKLGKLVRLGKGKKIKHVQGAQHGTKAAKKAKDIISRGKMAED
ncbi:MAG: hypothetical protein SVU32_08100 [Candidatus Nanohaloarchaea archaeon]|nr:hypothetical protein [Candidatus Nanohaloarchaea archaeon]